MASTPASPERVESALKNGSYYGVNVHKLLVNSFVQTPDRLGRREDMRDDSAEVLFQSFLQETLAISSGMGRDVRSLMLSIHYFLCRP